jgi:serine/threonine protein kinase
MPFSIGQLVLKDKYRIEALIGQGAFAQVYRARHLALNAERAIKGLHQDTPGISSTEYEEFRLRFQLEAQMGDQLDSPNLIRVYDFEQEGDAYLLVMEYAQGGSLEERIRQMRKTGQPFPVERVIKIGKEIALGLGALHAKDAVHRDLKPSNILFDKKGCAKVADLGLAQVPGGPSMRSQLSQALRHPGTAGYMSPEQEQSSLLLRPASDIYVLGIILFEVLTGRNYNYLKPGTKARDLNPDTPYWLNDLLMRMLSDDPKDRPWDGTDTAELLRKGEEVTEVNYKTYTAQRDANAKGLLADQPKVQRAAEEKVYQEVGDIAQRNADKKTKNVDEERLQGSYEKKDFRRKVEIAAQDTSKKETALRFTEKKAKKPFIIFLASGNGRIIRFIVGVSLVIMGLFVVSNPMWIAYVLLVIGLVPLLAAIFDVCIFAPLFSLPFDGKKLRAR